MYCIFGRENTHIRWLTLERLWSSDVSLHLENSILPNVFAFRELRVFFLKKKDHNQRQNFQIPNKGDTLTVPKNLHTYVLR